MDFRFTPEQEMLRDSVATALARSDQAGHRAALAHAGIHGIFLDADAGGLGLGMVEAAIVATEVGRACVAGPVIETIAALPVLAAAKPDLTAGLVEGRIGIAASSSCEVTRLNAGLKGTAKSPWLADADWLALPLAAGTVAIVPTDRLRHRGGGAIDLDTAADTVTIDLGPDEVIVAQAPTFADRLSLLRAAEMAGAARQCFDLAVAYLKDRTQFGRPIGANQALKHLAADDFVRIESMRVAVEYAAAAHDRAAAADACRDDVEDAHRAHMVVLSYVPEAARLVAENAIQMHGGIGATWDYALNRPARRILRLGASLGWSATHRRALADLLRGAATVPAAINEAAE